MDALDKPSAAMKSVPFAKYTTTGALVMSHGKSLMLHFGVIADIVILLSSNS